MTWVGRILSSRFLGYLGVHALTQALQVVGQLLLVPVMATQWGLETYGIWLILFTIPGYLAASDFGLALAAGNVMSARVARGDLAGAAVTWRALHAIVLISSGLLLAGCLAVLGGLWPDLLDFAGPATGGHALMVALMMAGYGLLCIQTTLNDAGYRAIGQYVGSGYFSLALTSIETVAAIVLVMNGCGIVEVASAYLVLRAMSVAIMALFLRTRAPWIATAERLPLGAELRSFSPLALAGSSMSLANVLVFQGVVSALALALGPAAVPVFTVTRTLSRFPVQLSFLVSRAAMPQLTVADARQDKAQLHRLASIAVTTSALVLVPCGILFALFGHDLVGVWTHGMIRPTALLVWIMALVMVLNGFSQTLSILVQALNRHGQYALLSLVLAGMAVGATYGLSADFGASGAALALLAMETAMVCRIIFLVRRNDLFGLVQYGSLFRLGSAGFRQLLRPDLPSPPPSPPPPPERTGQS
jgi:O-antigen/teichoic acid export membrane protein